MKEKYKWLIGYLYDKPVIVSDVTIGYARQLQESMIVVHNFKPLLEVGDKFATTVIKLPNTLKEINECIKIREYTLTNKIK